MSSSSSSKRLAVVVAAGHHATATASDPNNQHMSLKSPSNRSTHVNLILASFFLGSVLVVSCMCMCMNYCCKTKMRRRSNSTQGKMLHIPPDSPNLDSSIYTLQGDCPHRMQYCDASVPPPYRRPPTPGPPPAYESVVSKNSKYRKFGETDEFSDEEEKLGEKDEVHYCRLMPENEKSMSRLDKLRHCKFHGSCSLYAGDDGSDNEIGVSKITVERIAESLHMNEDSNNSRADNNTTSVTNGDNSYRNGSEKIANKIDHLHHKEYCFHDRSGINDENDTNARYSENVNTIQIRINEDDSSGTSSNLNPNFEEVDYKHVDTIINIQETDDAGDQVLPSYEDAMEMASKNNRVI